MNEFLRNARFVLRKLSGQEMDKSRFLGKSPPPPSIVCARFQGIMESLPVCSNPMGGKR
jgi:hypothetical protein